MVCAVGGVRCGLVGEVFTSLVHLNGNKQNYQKRGNRFLETLLAIFYIKSLLFI